jgi:hypothetical protein
VTPDPSPHEWAESVRNLCVSLTICADVYLGLPENNISEDDAALLQATAEELQRLVTAWDES